MNANKEFEHHAARAFFASAWADQCEESGQESMLIGKEIMSLMPAETDPAATHAARTLRMDIERTNGRSVADLMEWIKARADGDRPATLEFFGHYAAMQAMGHGVGMGDAFGSEVRERIHVPYVEFGAYSLEREYF